MSDITQLIRRAMDCGVALCYADGGIKVMGRVNVVRQWAPRLRPHRARLIEALRPAPEPVEPAVDWKPLARAYNDHHFNCPVCIAAGKGYGLRCGAGAALWATYQNTN